jgi:general secretion pathway protein G
MDVVMRRFLCLGILLTFVFGVACSIYRDSRDRARAAAFHAREDALKMDLLAMRQAINQYSSEKGVPPQSLNDLVVAEYLHQIPMDPITERQDWRVIIGEVSVDSKKMRGIIDVRSVAVQKGSTGTTYSEW